MKSLATPRLNSIGFTGTQKGMTDAQQTMLEKVLAQFGRMHHGDCIGADEQAHFIAKRLGLRIHIHPPEKNNKRAFCEGDEIYKCKPYLVRNHAIVSATSCLIATPKSFEEELRSGTWATVRYARQRGRPLGIIWPDGTLSTENEYHFQSEYLP